MKILGIWDGHDASAALLTEEGLLAAVAEERLTRRKMQRGFPFQAVAALLDGAGLAAGDIDQVAVAGRYGRAPVRLLQLAYARAAAASGPMSPAARLYRHYENGIAILPGVRVAERAASLSLVRRCLRKCGFPAGADAFLVPHHAAHAAAAASMCSEDGLVVTMDGYGDGLWATATAWRDGRPELLDRRPYLGSVAVTYGSVCQFLGYAEGEEGKVTALAAAGNPGPLADWFLARVNGRHAGGGPLSPLDCRHLARFSPEDVAAAVQALVERVALDYVERHLGGAPGPCLSVAGGLFANVTLNRALVDRFPERTVTVYPAMGDAGLSVGAALHLQQALGARPAAFPGPYLGLRPRFRDSGHIDGVRTIRTNVPERECARILADGGTVALVSGREEFGPRALGNRSLLFPARSRELADRVQQMLRRDPVMPFAPVCRAKHVEALFEPPYPAPERADKGLALMTFAVRARPGVADRFPAAVHVDGTARVQAVTGGTHRSLYRILAEYEKRTGEEMLINTSFNLHGEPIVHDAEDAVRTFLDSGVDALLLGKVLFVRDTR